MINLHLDPIKMVVFSTPHVSVDICGCTPFIYHVYTIYIPIISQCLMVKFPQSGGPWLPPSGGRRLCPTAQARAAECSQAHVGVLLKLGYGGMMLLGWILYDFVILS